MSKLKVSETQSMGPGFAVVNFRGSFVFLSFLFIHQRVLSELINKPVDSECLVNETIYFNCSSSITAKEIDWYHYPVGVEAHQRKTVYAFGKLYKDYEKDFVLENNSLSGAYNLVIQSVKSGYAGQYECHEEGGFGNSIRAQLIVLDDDPECNSNINPHGVIGPNACGIQPDDLHLSCSVTYHGNIPPQLKWIKVGENDDISLSVTKGQSANRITCNLTVKADLITDKSSYECHITKSGTSKHSCISETIRLCSENTSDNGSSSTYVVVGVVLGVSLFLLVALMILLWIRRRRNSTNTGVVVDKRSEKTQYPLLPNDTTTVETPELKEVENDEILEREEGAEPGATENDTGGREYGLHENEEDMLNNAEEKDEEEHPDGQPLTQQAEQKKATSSISPSEQSKDATNMTTNGEEQNDETNINESNEETDVEETNEKEKIERHREFLKEHLDPDFGLFDTLRANKTLSGEEISEVKGKSSFYRRNSQLFKYILEKHQYDGLIEALKDNEQLHIVNYLNANGVYDSAYYGEEWPLTSKEKSILDTNQKSLVDLLDLSILLDLLYSVDVVNRRQMELISSEPTLCRKNEALLDILRRRSLHDFQKTISCLNCSNQRRIAEVFESGGVILEVHAHLVEPSENVSTTEDEISTRFAKELNGKSFEESRRICDLAHLKLIAAKKGRSIILYIWCEVVEELLHLQELLTSGRLKDSAEQLFNQLLTHSQRVAVKNITMNDEDFRRLKAYFTVDTTQFEEPSSSPAVQVIPYTGLGVKLIRTQSRCNSFSGQSGSSLE